MMLGYGSSASADRSTPSAHTATMAAAPRHPSVAVVGQHFIPQPGYG